MKFWLRGSLLVFLVTSVLRLSLSAEGAPPASKTKDVQLNVVFHGLFSYIVWPDHVEVLAPMVDEHIYKAGAWGKEFRLRENAVYHLEGVQVETRMPDIDVRNNIVLTNVSNIDRSPEKLFCSFILPLPQQMIGLRRAYAPPNQPAFHGAALNGPNPDSIPLIQTFVYRVDGWPTLGEKFGWIPEDSASDTINLHIWAEPEVDASGMQQKPHAVQAFSRLMALFPDVDLHLSFGAAASPDKSTHVHGLEVWEERSLMERCKLLFPRKPRNREVGKGTEVSNCVGVIILNK
jgi:hypothetical protein